MSSSCAVRITPPRVPRLHSCFSSVEYEHAEKEFRREFSSIIGAAPRGVTPLPLQQMSKDIGSGNNKLVRSLVRFGFGCQDASVPTDMITSPMLAFIGTLRARGPQQKALSVDELLELEVKINAQVAPLEWAFTTKGHPGPIRRMLIKTFEELRERIDDALDRLYREEKDDLNRSKHS